MSLCDKPAPYHWTAEDYAALRSAASDLGVKAEDLLLILYYESGLNPGSVNCWPDGSYPNAVGLNQITKPAAGAMKITESERLGLLKLTAAQQLPYVVRSFRASGVNVKGADVVTLYQTNLGPATVPNEVIYVSPSVNYRANKGLDVDGDGKITRSDLATVLATTAKKKGYQQALKELGGEAPVISSSPARSSSTGVLVFAGAAIAGAVLLFRK